MIYIGCDPGKKGAVAIIGEGENPKDASDGLTEKKERIAYWRKQIVFMRNVGFDSRGLYALAATEGITREEIDSYEDAGP